MNDVVNNICICFGVLKMDILGTSRNSKLVDIRKFIAYTLYAEYNLKHADIAILLKKNRTTSYYHVKDFEERKDIDNNFKQLREEFRRSNKIISGE